MLHDRCVVVEESFLPVSTETGNLITVNIGDVVWIRKICHISRQCLLAVDILLVHQHSIVGGTGNITLLPCALPSVREVVVDRSLANLSFLGSHEDNTIGSSRTIDSTRGSILQHLNRLDIGRVNRFHTILVGRHSVDDVKRFGIVDSTDTTHADH